MARASRRWWWGGLALLMVLSACGRRAKPAAVPVPAMTAPEPAAETASEKHYPKVGFRLTLPASWHETPAPAELARDGKGTAVAFSQGTGELPRVMVTGIDKVAYARWVGTHLEATPVERAKVLGEELKQSLLGGESGGHKLGVVSERVWTARGIKSAWRIRFRGAGAGRPQTGDLIVAEDFRGGVFVIMVEANDDAGLDQADKLLDTMAFFTPPGPASAHPGLGGGLTSPMLPKTGAGPAKGAARPVAPKAKGAGKRAPAKPGQPAAD